MPVAQGRPRRRIKLRRSRETWNRQMMVRLCCIGGNPRRVRLRRHLHLHQLRRQHRRLLRQARQRPRRPTMIVLLCIGGTLSLRHLRLHLPQPRRILLRPRILLRRAQVDRTRMHRNQAHQHQFLQFRRLHKPIRFRLHHRHPSRWIPMRPRYAAGGLGPKRKLRLLQRNPLLARLQLLQARRTPRLLMVPHLPRSL